MSELISYEDWIEDIHEYRRTGPLGEEVTGVVREPRDPERFLTRSDASPFCGTPMAQEISELFVVPTDPDESYYFTLRHCPACGWWDVYNKWQIDRDYIEKVDQDVIVALRWAIAKRFEVSSGQAPIAALMEETRRRPERLYEVHPTKLEELVGAVFAAHFNCTVEHVGRSHDGGVDLVVVDSDNPLLVQVKRRERENHVESASLVREFIGAVYLKDANRGAIVSTARRFSPMAQAHAQSVTARRKFEQFDLIDFARLRDMLRLAPPQDSQPWRKHLEALRHVPF